MVGLTEVVIHGWDVTVATGQALDVDGDDARRAAGAHDGVHGGRPGRRAVRSCTPRRRGRDGTRPCARVERSRSGLGTPRGTLVGMDPVTALRQIAYYKDRARVESRRVMAYRNAADVVESARRRAAREARQGQQLAVDTRGGAEDRQGDRPGVGRSRTRDAHRIAFGCPEDLGGGEIRTALRGDLHLHSNWSDGSAPISEMMATAQALGHEYCALTDHSPRLTVAHGLSPGAPARAARRHRRTTGDASRPCGFSDRHRGRHPRRRLASIRRTSCSMRLDIVVASVHSKLKPWTRRP